MSSDYDISDDEENYYSSDEDMIDGTQDDGQFVSFHGHSPIQPHPTESSQSEADIDMGDYADDFKVVAKGKRKPYEIEHESLTQADIENLVHTDVEDICGICGVDVSLSFLHKQQ